MESQELLQRIDEVRKRLPVSHGAARAALEEKSYDVLEAVLLLEAAQAGKTGSGLPAFASGLNALGSGRSLALQRGQKELLRVPAAAAALSAALLGLVRPRLFTAAIGLILISGTDIRLTGGAGKDYSLHDTLKRGAGLSKGPLGGVGEALVGRLDEGVQGIRERKEKSFSKDSKEPSAKYFTIKL